MKTILLWLSLLMALGVVGADVKITALPTTNAVHTPDIFPLVTQPGSSPVTKSATLGVIANSLSADQGMLTNGSTVPIVLASSLRAASSLYVDTAKMTDNGSGKLIAESGFVGDGSSLTALNATQLTSGSVPAARFGSLTVPLSALAQSSAASGQVIEWNGSAWVATDVQGVTIPNTFTQTNLVANQLYTNTSGSVQMIIGEVALVTAAGVSGRSSFDVMVDQTGGTTYARYTVAAVQTTALTLAQNYTNSFATAVSNSAAFYLTNSSAGSGDSATLVSGQCQLLTLSDGAAAGVAMLSANNTFTGTNSFTGPVTVSGSYNVFGQTYFTGPINETNGNLIVTNSSAANQGVTIRTNGTLTVDAGITNPAVGPTKVVITDSGGKEVAATLSGLTLSGTTLTAGSTQYEPFFGWIQSSWASTGIFFPWDVNLASASVSSTEAKVTAPTALGGTVTNVYFYFYNSSGGGALGSGTNITMTLVTNGVNSNFAVTFAGDGSHFHTNSGTQSVALPVGGTASWAPTWNTNTANNINHSWKGYVIRPS
jgi:fibronectin-binding autotransporter adhesin